LFVCVFVCFLWLESDVIFIARENGRHECKDRGRHERKTTNKEGVCFLRG
jgi:hypothetical protein